MMRPSSLYRSASVSSLSTSSSGPRRSTLDLASLLDAMGGDKVMKSRNETSLYNNNISITPDECDLYAGSFFSPPRPARHPNRPGTDEGDLFAGTDPSKQFVRFERSVYKLDRLLGMRHFNKLNSMPDRIDSAEPNTQSNAQIPSKKIEDWLGNITESGRCETAIDSNRERRREQMMRMKVTDVMKKAMLIGFEAAFLIEREVLESLSVKLQSTSVSGSTPSPSPDLGAKEDQLKSVPIETMQNWDQVLGLVDSSKRPIPLFDSDSLSLLTSTQLAYLLESFGITRHITKQPKHSAYVRSWLEVTVAKLRQLIAQGKEVLDEEGMMVRVGCVLSNTRRLDDLLLAIQNKERMKKGRAGDEGSEESENSETPCTPDVDKAEPSKSMVTWTPELDAELVGYTEAFLRRRDQATVAFASWKSSYGPVLPERFTKSPNETIWRLVARELRKGTGARISPNACKRRYISVQRASL